MKIKLVFFATPDISLKSFEKLISSDDFEVVALVTQPPKPARRGKKIVDSNVKKLAMAHNIEVLEPYRISKEPDAIEKLKSLDVDFFVTFAFGQILSQEVLDIPRFHTINLHASLLPKYRGANPICECLLNGDSCTGITTMITVLELDAGDICLTEPIELVSDTTFPELSGFIAEKAPDLITKTLKDLYSGALKPTPQCETGVTHTKKMQKADKEIKFCSTNFEVHNKARAMLGVNTNYTLFNGKLVQVLSSEIQDCESGFENGEIIEVSKSGILVKCGCGAVLLKRVKPEGKAEMSAYDWSLGSQAKKGSILGV